MKKHLLAASLLTGLAASGVGATQAYAQSARSAPMSSDMPTAALTPMASAMAAPGSSDYVMMAGQSDAYEMQSSQIALANAKSARVKGFAKMMIADHTKTTAALMKAAAKSSITPPPSPPPLNADQQQMIAQLQSAMGADFDRAYVSQQVTAHQIALDLHSSYAKDGADPGLKKAAAAAVPIVTRHLEMVRAMSAGMGSR